MVSTRTLRLFSLNLIFLTCSEADPIGDGLSIADILEVPVISVACPGTSFQHLDKSTIVAHVKVEPALVIAGHVESVSGGDWRHEPSLQAIGHKVARQRVGSLSVHLKRIVVRLGVKVRPVPHVASGIVEGSSKTVGTRVVSRLRNGSFRLNFA
jgi:hypothetical protein